jgi:hypothetical protein
VLIVIGALAWDLRPSPTTAFPFAIRLIAEGEPIESDAVEWRRVPGRFVGPPDLNHAVAAVDIPEADPITAAVLSDPVSVPDGWFAMPVDVGGHAAAGDRVVLMLTDPPLSVPGVVVAAQSGDRFSLDFVAAVVAVPGEHAVDVAAASVRGQVVAAVAGGP